MGEFFADMMERDVDGMKTQANELTKLIGNPAYIPMSKHFKAAEKDKHLMKDLWLLEGIMIKSLNDQV